MQKRKSRSKRPKYKQGQGDGTAEEAEHLEFEGYGDADQITPFGFKDFKEALPEDSNTEDRKASDYAKCYWCNKQAFDLKKCTRCKIAQYCDRQCQKAHWSDHKLTCREGGAPSFSTSETLHSKKEESASKEHQSCVNVVHSRPLHEQVPCFNCKEHRETLKKCNQCQIAMYCDKECQKAHWPEHKTVCRHLSNKDSGKNSDQGCASFLTSGSRTQPTNGDDEESCCLCCGKSKTGLIKCSGCQTVNYCNEQCELDDRLGHGKACGIIDQNSSKADGERVFTGERSMWSDEIKRVYEYYENRLIKLLGDIGRKWKNGVRYIMWQEVMNNNLQLPNDTIIQVWMGDMGDVMRDTSLGYNVLYSTCWYLDHIEYGTKWPKYYHCDPVDQSYGYHIDEKKVLGGEAAFWSEYFTNENLLPMMWPRASAIAERLWSNKEVKNLEKAAARLSEHRCRMLKRGINAGEISGPGYCLHSPPKRCLFNDTIGCKGGNCSRQHNFVEIEDIQVHVSQRGGGLSECGNALSRGDTGIMILLILTFVLILFMITLTRSSSRFGRIRHCKNRSILLVFALLLLVYFLCYTTIGLRAFEFSGSIHKTFQEDKRSQSKDGLPSLDGFQEQKRLLS